jgi:hypothetical protein
MSGVVDFQMRAKACANSGHETLSLGPEVNGIADPALRDRTDARAETVTKTPIHLELDPCSKRSQDVYASPHTGRRRDAIVFAHHSECGWLVIRVIGMGGVRQHHSRGLRKVRAAERGDACDPTEAAILAPAELPHSEYPSVDTPSARACSKT